MNSKGPETEKALLKECPTGQKAAGKTVLILILFSVTDSWSALLAMASAKDSSSDPLDSRHEHVASISVHVKLAAEARCGTSSPGHSGTPCLHGLSSISRELLDQAAAVRVPQRAPQAVKDS